ncbi:MAG: MAPEG family protein [Acidobacteria bacterium]|nr:MAG: MAPEG family protein [Acidobacteriota bacterium]REK07270.1 MAG: MAPEG family protein [Acidobacteriota bacterium]
MLDTIFLLPLVTLVGWTLVVWIWMYATRIPAILRTGMALDPEAPRGSQMAQLPARVRWKADNYDHLLEQPTLFYALTLAFAMIGPQETSRSVALACCWAYVGLRMVHSLVQTLGNRIEARFAVFVLSTLPLFVLVGLALLEVL